MHRTSLQATTQHLGIGREPPFALGDFGYRSGIYKAFPPDEFPEILAGDMREAALCAIGAYAIYKKGESYEGLRVNPHHLGKYHNLPRIELSANPDKTKNSIVEGKKSSFSAIVLKGAPEIATGTEMPLYFENRPLRAVKIDTNLVYPGEPIPIVHMTHNEISDALNRSLLR